jgi:hypothetical protein
LFSVLHIKPKQFYGEHLTSCTFETGILWVAAELQVENKSGGNRHAHSCFFSEAIEEQI